MGAMALHGYSSMELKSRNFTSKEPHVAREPQFADPCTRVKRDLNSEASKTLSNFLSHCHDAHLPSHITLYAYI
jgi:hypothetical protein